MSEIVFSCIIPCKSKDDPLLQDCIQSIKSQDFPQDKVEILVITEGDAESARAKGYKEAKGEICLAIDSDNYLTSENLFKSVSAVFSNTPGLVGCYSMFYAYLDKDNSLNRYFSLIGNNDPIAFYLGKCDRKPHFLYDPLVSLDLVAFKDSVPTLGCNGFFIRKSCVMQADLDHGYHIDICEDLRAKGMNRYARINCSYLWHRTSDSLFKILRKRYRYAKNFYCNRKDRRWRMLDTKRDYWRLFLFVLASITVIQPLLTSIRGFIKIKDWAWFYHPLVCFSFLIMYGALFIKWKTSALLSRLLADLRAFDEL